MKLPRLAVLLFLLFIVPLSAIADNQRASMTTDISATDPLYTDTLGDIKKTLGLVPTFFKGFPPVALPGAWTAFKSIQLSSTTAIPAQYKELIGLAVASQIPCHYCTYFHTTAAKLNKATEPQVQEAVAMAAIARQWSTALSGAQLPLNEFKAEIDRGFKKMAEDAKTKNAPYTIPKLTTAESAYKDMELLFGFLPSFAKAFPRDAIAGVWTEARALAFNPNTAIPLKYKDLISLAVSSQIPCPYAVYIDTQSAKLDGATDQEISEAIAMASSARHWSTVLNGLQTDDATFKREMKQVFTPAKSAAATTTPKK